MVVIKSAVTTNISSDKVINKKASPILWRGFLACVERRKASLVVIKKVEMAIDLTRPAEEIVGTILVVLSYFPSGQLEILQNVDHRVGEMLAALQQPQKESEEATDSSVTEEK
jgi:hypothetical protein